MISFDLSKIRTHADEAGEGAQVSRPVGVTEFQHAGKHLYYINAHHVNGINNPTCDMVAQTITRFNPDLIIVESVATGDEKRSGFVAFVKEQALSGFTRGGERAYTVHLAMQNHIPFVGGEPSLRDIFSGLQEEGYSTKDVMGFYLLKSIANWPNQGILDENALANQAVRQLELVRQWAGIPETNALTYDEFVRWFEAHNTTGKGFLQIKENDIRPLNSANANYFQKLCHTMDPIRERHLDTVIEKSFEDHNAVLVVFGDAHLEKSRPVFEKAFGPGTTLKFE